jgi:nucleoside-diphosphate-sugar epimerase
VTGGSGFIGGRLVEVLANQGFHVRVTTSDFRHCARVSRLAIELVKADLSDHEALSRAVAGCNVIFHAAYRFGGAPEEERRVNLDGTRTLAEAFLKEGGRRFVHISSITAYGEPRDGEITEESARRPSRDAYGNIKQEIERALLQLHQIHGLAVTILQPTIVYGPYGYFFTIRPLEELRSTRIALPAGGLCNAVYVDDVVSAAMLAAEREAAVGEMFIISGSSPTTWREFYAAYERMLNKTAVVELDDVQIRREERRQRKSRHLTRRLRLALARRPELRQRVLNLPPLGWLLAGGQRILPDPVKAALKRRYESLWSSPFEAPENSQPLYVHDGFWRAIYAAKSRAQIDKARKQLGYDPVYDLDEGMARTAEWARWANLLSV